MVNIAMKLKDISPWNGSYDKPKEHIKKQRHQFADKGPYSKELCFFQYSCTDVKNGPQRRLSPKKLMFSGCGAGEGCGESLGLKGDQISQS